MAFLLLFLSNSLRTIKGINNGKKEGGKKKKKPLSCKKQGNYQDLWNVSVKYTQNVESEIVFKKQSVLPTICMILTLPSVEEAFWMKSQVHR